METKQHEALAVIELESSPVLHRVKRFDVKTENDVEKASAFLKELKVLEKGIEQKRLSFSL